MSLTLIVSLVAAILVFWILGAYNRIVRLRGQVTRNLQALVSQWQLQAQAVGLHLEQYAQGRDTESQWATLDDDALRWRPITLSARQFLACLAILQTKAQQLAAVDDVSSVQVAREIFEANWLRLKNAQEDLAGTPVPPELQLLWAKHEPISHERLHDYNEAVRAYHQAITQFPTLLIAWVFGFGATAQLVQLGASPNA